MRKADKKIENALVKVLTEVCELAKEKYIGFKWITHFVDYKNFPKSLLIVCIYDTNKNLNNSNVEGLCKLINEKLLSIDIKIQDLYGQVSFDSEEKCHNENNGNWKKRFK